MIPQLKRTHPQPSSSHLLPSFLHPPLPLPPPLHPPLLEEEVTCCRPAPCHLADFLSSRPQERESGSAGCESSPHAAEPRTPERKKNYNSREKSRAGRWGGDAQTTVQVRKKTLLLEKMITCVTISFVLLSNSGK